MASIEAIPVRNFYKILIIVLIATTTSTQDPCRWLSTCHDCIQTPQCAWCFDSNYNKPRCSAPELNNFTCSEEMIYNPDNMLSVVSSKQIQLHPRDSNVNPEKFELFLRPKTSYSTSITYTYGWNSSKSTVEMNHNATDDVSLKFFTKCLNSESDWTQTNTCDGLKTGSIIIFKIEFELLKCPKNSKDFQQIIQVFPKETKTFLLVDLKMICSCPCESPGSQFYIEQAPECSSHGTYKCGICECETGSYGNNCECSSEGDGCTPPNSTKICSNKGQCICGSCACDVREDPDEKIFGKFCECDNFSCPRKDEVLCSGHGRCNCGKCSCDSGWTGEDCSCTHSNDTCFRPETTDKEPCSGNGTCQCGACICKNSPEGSFSGQYCEIPPVSPNNENSLIFLNTTQTNPENPIIRHQRQEPQRCPPQSNYACKRNNGIMCSGHGSCLCGVCYCNAGWSREDCSCQQTETNCYDPRRPQQKCNGNGICECGTCKCNTIATGTYSGRYCETPPGRIAQIPGCQEAEIQCYDPRNPRHKCSGHGNCECGTCKCSMTTTGPYSGQFCEISPPTDASVCQNAENKCYDPRDPRLICHGNGKCDCGTCKCITTASGPYSGRYCENLHIVAPPAILVDENCQKQESYCYDPKNPRQKCHGNGKCDCGTCKCNVTTTGPYSGRYCEISPPNSAENKCQQVEHYCYDPRNPRKICNGNGICDCGTCKCSVTTTEIYSGRYCENRQMAPPSPQIQVDETCRKAETYCYDPRNPRQKCHGNGVCDCGICKCNHTNTGAFSGRYCENSPPSNPSNERVCQEAERYCYDTRNPRKICNGNGNCECGRCKCSENYSGNYCENLQAVSQKQIDATCQKAESYCYDPRNSRQKCHGRGICNCGTCKCNMTTTGPYSGRYCENLPPKPTPIEDKACQEAERLCYDPRNPFKICSGNGNCDCGKCKCLVTHSGRYCENRQSILETAENCLQAETYCYDPRDSRQKCHGNGICDCGICKCNTTTTGQYSGRYCEKSPPKPPIIEGRACQDAERYCRDPRNPLKFCNDNGICDCGTCKCSVTSTGPYSGRYCETLPVLQNIVDKNSCQEAETNCYDPRNPRVKCNGNGICDCGTCRCNSTTTGKYSGRFCETPPERKYSASQEVICRKLEGNCYNPRDPSQKCSGIGKCFCGHCYCNTELGEYSGTYCEYPPKKSLEQQICPPPTSNHSCPASQGVLCSGHGSCVCGICVCVQGWSGNDCSCQESKRNCYDPRNPFQECHGNGQCECGKCKCSATTTGPFSGQYCELSPPPAGTDESPCPPQSKFECPVTNGSMCNGHGDCFCGVCYCKPGWSGDSCSCQESSCYDPRNPHKKCNGNGKCDCGRCKCSMTDNASYSGRYCEILATTSPYTVETRVCQEAERNCYDPRNPREKCHGNGQCDCGTCKCSMTPTGIYTGRYCENSPEISSESAARACQEAENNCYDPRDPRQKCHGKGQCDCGSCKCAMTSNGPYSGRYCEISPIPPKTVDDDCRRVERYCYDPRNPRQKCSGNGECDCGKCKCNTTAIGPYFGQFCENSPQGGVSDRRSCQDSENNCYDPRDPRQKCSGNGICDCGTCRCNTSPLGVYSGRYCEIPPITQPTLRKPTINSCISPTNHLECSGRGRCLNGTCQCERGRSEQERIFGNFCECDNYSCQRHNGLLCGGHDHGMCYCGRCVCNNDWTGENCSCPKSTSTCYNPNLSDKVCSGQGTCECGTCKCNENYSGRYCENCLSCQPNKQPLIFHKCYSQSTCNKCIQNSMCSWCLDPNFGTNYRCLPVNDTNSCPKDFVYNPESTVSVLTSPSSPIYSNKSQINPQHMYVALRPGQRIKASLQYTHVTSDSRTSSSVELANNAKTSIDIKFYSNCLNRNGPMLETNRCDYVNYGDTIQFEIEFGLTNCPENNLEWISDVVIRPVHGRDKSVAVVEMLCQCACEDPSDPNYIERAPQCYGHGSYQCGTCDCEKGYTGRFCERRVNVMDNYDDPECSGRGQSINGRCQCQQPADPQEKIYGTHCECDNFSCEKHQGLICGGPSRGQCQCGRCVCNEAFTGPSCSCSLSNDTCYNPQSRNFCSGHGICDCGVCKCQEPHSGRFCENCLTCQKYEIPPLATLPPLPPPIRNECESKRTCGSCMQVPSCGWCLDPKKMSKSRCFLTTENDSLDRCAPEFLLNPENSMTVEEMESLSDSSLDNGKFFPHSVIMEMRPRTPMRLSIKYVHSSTWKMTPSIELTHDAPNHVNIKFFTNCLNQNIPTETNRCDNLRNGDTVEFLIEIEILRCPDEILNWFLTIKIKPRNSLNQNFLNIELETICSCQCEEADDPDYVEEAEQCNRRGTLMCRVCNCDRGFTGESCEHELPQLRNNLMLRYMPTHPQQSNQIRRQHEENPTTECGTKSNCDHCIQSNCAWCFDPNFNSGSRCFSISDNQRNQCRDEFIFNPDNALSITPSNPTTKPFLYSKGSATITYQRLNLKLRTNHSYPLQLFYNNPKAQRVSLAYSASSGVIVRFFSKCLNTENLVETSKCPNSNGQPIEFRLSIEVVKCPKNKKDWNQTIRIYPVDVYDNYLIDLEMLCGCSCGPLCESKQLPQQPASDSCISPLNNLECSGKGRCLNGVCQCVERPSPFEMIYGTFCECDNFSCERYNGQICGGPTHGKCDCGRCVCSEGWTGNSCNCQSNQTCYAPGSKNICSNHGNCECGICVCNQHYTGHYCEHCPMCSLQNIETKTIRNNCETKSTCDDCVQTPSCGWCYDINQPPRSRCFESTQQNLCGNNFFFNPNNSVTVVDVGPIATIRDGPTQNSIFPARVSVKLRKNKPQQLVMVFVKGPQQWVGNLEMAHNATEAYNLKFFTSCSSAGGTEIETNRCSHVASKDMIEFKILIELVQCTDRKTETLQVNPRGIDNRFIIDVETLCGCS